jgi:hypothetical protein
MYDLLLRSWRWREYVAPKCTWASTKLYSVTSQKLVLIMILCFLLYITSTLGQWSKCFFFLCTILAFQFHVTSFLLFCSFSVPSWTILLCVLPQFSSLQNDQNENNASLYYSKFTTFQSLLPSGPHFYSCCLEKFKTSFCLISSMLQSRLSWNLV